MQYRAYGHEVVDMWVDMWVSMGVNMERSFV